MVSAKFMAEWFWIYENIEVPIIRYNSSNSNSVRNKIEGQTNMLTEKKEFRKLSILFPATKNPSFSVISYFIRTHSPKVLISLSHLIEMKINSKIVF